MVASRLSGSMENSKIIKIDTIMKLEVKGVKNKYLSNVEVEAMLGLWLISALMVIRGGTLLFVTDAGIERSSMYSTMNEFAPIQIWAIIFIIGGVIILSSSVSQSTRKYYGLIVGNVLGALVSLPFAFISFAESHMSVTQFIVTLVAFYNLVMILHGGVTVWREKRKIRTLQKLK